MMNTFTFYKPRKTEFQQLATVKGWNVKVYTITNQNRFKSKTVLENAIANLPKWLERSKLLGLETHKTAFLIVHEGRDGIWSLLNWWIGGEMLQSVTFYTGFDNPNEFEETPKEGFMACVWEMAVIDFERTLWIEHILKKADQPDFQKYFENYLIEDELPNQKCRTV